MSRIGKLPITVPAGVTVKVEGNVVSAKGPKGELKRTIPAEMKISHEGSTITVARPSDEPQHKALHGLSRTLIANMVEGVSKGFQKQLEIAGVGFKAEPKPFGLQLALGYSHQISTRRRRASSSRPRSPRRS